MSASKQSSMPDTLVILFFVGLFAVALNYLVPEGRFDTHTVLQQSGDGEVTRNVIVPESYQRVADSERLPLFSADGMGILNAPFEGLVSGTKWGAAVGVVAFIILIGGAFGIIMQTRSIEHAILSLVATTQASHHVFLALLFLTFSFGGAIFGMGEEAIAFCLVLLPVMRAMGYNALVTVFVTYVATQIGFATSWMNPFSVAIAQSLADVPVLSGAGYRASLWVVFSLLGLTFLLRYASQLKRQSQPRSDGDAESMAPVTAKMAILDWAILATFAAGIIWVVWGVAVHAYYIPQIASQFFALGLVIGLLAIIGGRMRANQVAEAFTQGAQQLLPAALIVGLAKGVVLILGGDDPTQASTLNTLLHGAGQLLGDIPQALAAIGMLVMQGSFNFLVTSGSGQAALTMPLMAPLADLVGVSRQVAVLAFQLGDGLTNLIVPTSAALIGCLGAVKVSWVEWFKFIWRFQCWLFVFSVAAIWLAVLIGF